jgi:hypothetical protein
MNKPPETEPKTACPSSDDQNNWLYKVKLLLERSVLACHQIIEFNEGLISTEQHSADKQVRFNMLPTEMIVAMYNLRVGIEEALLSLAAVGLPTDLKEKVKDTFIEKKEGNESTDIELLFQRVVEEGGPEGFLPAAKVQVPSDIGVRSEEYQGTFDFLKEMTSKYQKYDLKNVPKAMSGVCWKGNKISNPFTTIGNNEQSCSHLQNPQSASDASIDPEELVKYQKMCAELIEDANAIYGQFDAVGSIYLAAIQE